MRYSIDLELSTQANVEQLKLKIKYLTELIESDYRFLCDMKNHGIKTSNKKYHNIYVRYMRNHYVRAKQHEKLKAMGVNFK